ncbi:hypothetical protein RvY_11397 [Ramazzottius varieornatus]|uniref:Uncharacterized protein n=1 Tax=Ramazzottius varieornatus TaxID=947166 RepID=A0A1D1VG24_RAMVA|nr:hypothetical protein RvY_11397 [Ramazzottius varieornatus]
MALDVRAKLEEAFGSSGSSKELATLHAETFALNMKVTALYEGLLYLKDKVEEVLAYIHHDKDSITSGSASGEESLDTFESMHMSLSSLPPNPSVPLAEQSSELMNALTQPEEPRSIMQNCPVPRKTTPFAAPPRRRRPPAGRKSVVRSPKIEGNAFAPATANETEPSSSLINVSPAAQNVGRPRKAKQVADVEEKETRVKSPIATRSRSRSGPIKLTFPKNIFRTVEHAVAESDEPVHPNAHPNSLPAIAANVLLEHSYGVGEASMEEEPSAAAPKVQVGENQSKAGESSTESDDEMPLAVRRAPSDDRERVEIAEPSVAEALAHAGYTGVVPTIAKKRKLETGVDSTDGGGTPATKRIELAYKVGRLPPLVGKDASAGAAAVVQKGVQKQGLEAKSGSDARRKWEVFVQSEIQKVMDRKEWPEIMSKAGFTFHKIIQGEASPIFDKIMASTKEYCEAEKIACPSAQNVAYVVSSCVKAKTTK